MLLGTILVALDLRVFVFPWSDTPRRTDLIVVLGPWSNGPRLQVVRELLRRHPTTMLLVSVNNVAHDCPGIEKAFAPMAVHCYRPEPFTTRGEARGAAAFAARNGLRTVSVVTSEDQLHRAGVRFRRCFPADVDLIAATVPLRARLRMLPYQNAAMVKALIFERAC